MAGVANKSGPAGAGNKSLRGAGGYGRNTSVYTGGPATLADFQQRLCRASSGDRRGTLDGRYPLRDPALLPLTEYIRTCGYIGAATARDIFVVATNSDGNPYRRNVS